MKNMFNFLKNIDSNNNNNNNYKRLMDKSS